jgi:CelD/BcsL family acetyltransferase involved in cellulose biosynthesis
MAQAIVFCLFRGEECCAAALTFRTGNLLTGGVTCYLPAIAESYPGRLIVKTMTDWATANGIQQIDFNATDPWVAPFTDSVQEYCQLVIFNRGPYGRLMNATAQLLESRRRIRSSRDEERRKLQDVHSGKPM